MGSSVDVVLVCFTHSVFASAMPSSGAGSMHSTYLPIYIRYVLCWLWPSGDWCGNPSLCTRIQRVTALINREAGGICEATALKIKTMSNAIKGESSDSDEKQNMSPKDAFLFIDNDRFNPISQ